MGPYVSGRVGQKNRHDGLSGQSPYVEFGERPLKVLSLGLKD